MNFFVTLSAQLLTPFTTFSGVTSAALAQVVIPAILAMLSINIAWQGLNLVRGVGGQHLFLDLFANNFRAIVVLLFALSTGAGAPLLLAAANELQTSLIGYASPGVQVSSAAASLDTQLDVLINSYKTLLHAGFDGVNLSAFGANFSGVETIVVASVVALAMVLFMAFAFVEIVAVQAAIAMVVAISPLFIGAAAFRATSSYFSAWLNGLLRYSVEVAFLLMLVGIGLNVTTNINAHLASDLNSGQLSTQLDLVTLVLQAVGVTIILIYLTWKVDSIAASVFGGASVSGAAVALGAALGGAAGALAGLPGAAGAGSQGNPLGGPGGGPQSEPYAPGTGAIYSARGRQGMDTLGADWAITPAPAPSPTPPFSQGPGA